MREPMTEVVDRPSARLGSVRQRSSALRGRFHHRMSWLGGKQLCLLATIGRLRVAAVGGGVGLVIHRLMGSDGCSLMPVDI